MRRILVLFALLIIAAAIANVPSPSPAVGAPAVSSVIYLPLVMRGYAGARSWPETTNGIFIFNDQIDTRTLSEAQFQFAATH